MGHMSLCSFPPSPELQAKGIQYCDAGTIEYNVFTYEENMCSCESMAGSDISCEVTGKSEGGEDCWTESCSTNYGDCDRNDVNVPSTWLYSDFLSGTSFEAQVGMSGSDTYMLKSKGTLIPVLLGTGGHFTLPSDAGSGVVVAPKMTETSSFTMLGGEIVFLDVLVDAGATINFNGGAVVVMGGASAGSILQSGANSMKLTALTNTGTVRIQDNTAGVLITATINEPSGVVDLINTHASVHGVVNAGTVNLSGGDYIYKGGTNDGTINVDDSATAVYEADNSGTINFISGSATATVAHNSGTINIADGASGSLAITGSNAGTVTYKGQVVSASLDDGAVSISLP